MLPPEVILASAWFSVAQGLVAGPQLGLSLPLVGSTYAVSYGGVTDANPVLAGMIASNPASRMSFRITYPPLKKRQTLARCWRSTQELLFGFAAIYRSKFA